MEIYQWQIRSFLRFWLTRQVPFITFTPIKNVWDRELKRSKRGESKKIGTILGGQKDGKIRFDEAFLQEHPEFRNYQVERKGKDYVFTQISEEGITLEQARNIKKLHAGATWALDQIVADSPVGEFLKECFPRNKDYKKILSLAYFLILNQNNSVSSMKALQRRRDCRIRGRWAPRQ